MKKPPHKLLIGTIIFVFLSFILTAETIKFDSEKTQIVFTEGKERALLRGNAKVVTENSTVTAQEIELYGKDYQFILCRGKVNAVNREDEITLTSDRLYMDRDEDLTRAEGNAVMENRKDELIIKGGFIENRKKDDLTIIQIGVRILKKDMVARAEFARYKDKENMLELSGMPQVYWKGDEYKATRIIINTETDEIELQGEVSGSVKNSKEKESEKKQPADTPKSPDGTAAPAGGTGSSPTDTPAPAGSSGPGTQNSPSAKDPASSGTAPTTGTSRTPASGGTGS